MKINGYIWITCFKINDMNIMGFEPADPKEDTSVALPLSPPIPS